MFRQPSQSPYRMQLTQRADLAVGQDAGAIYVGLGDQFDDDRRLIRAAVPTSLSTWQATRSAKIKSLPST